MSATIVVKQYGIDSYEWLQFDNAKSLADDDVLPLFVGDGERLQHESELADNVIVLADAKTISIKQVAFEEHEKKLLDQTVPYSLEDECVDDVEDLHFALGGIQANSAPVAITRREELQETLEDIANQGVDVKQLVSEWSFIPFKENGWTLLLNNDNWLVRAGQYKGFTLDSSTIKLGLQLLLDESEVPPENITVYCSEEQQSVVMNSLPESLKNCVDCQSGDYWQVIHQGLKQTEVSATAINLLQGNFARRLPWLKWWKSWRVVGFLLVAAIAVQLISTYTELKILESRNVELRSEIEKSYRSVIPRGAVMDPERQLRRKVNAMKGASGDGFVVLLAKVAPVIAAIDEMSIQNLNYNEKQSEIRLTLLAAGFDDVETARTNLEKLGLKAELTGSNAEGDKTRARLKIRG